MKRTCIFTLMLLALLLCFSAVAEKAPLPEDMLPAVPYTFFPGQKFTVYESPDGPIAANGKGSVSTNGPIDVFGHDNGYMLIRYEISESKHRIGYIHGEDFGDLYSLPALTDVWQYGRVRVTEKTYLTDDPFQSRNSIQSLHAGDELILLYALNDFFYVETQTLPIRRGFVPRHAADEQPIPYAQKESLVSAVQQLRETGIDFDVTGLYRNYQDHLYFTTRDGGRIYYLDVGGEFYRYSLSSWYVKSISDSDFALFMDYFLNLAAEVAAGNASEEHLQPGYYNGLGESNIEAVVSNLTYPWEFMGSRALNILLEKLSAHDGNDGLNSMRAIAASGILGHLDKTPIDPAEGCAWYDALTLAAQNDLPMAESALYVVDPLMQKLTDMMISYNTEMNPWHSYSVAVDAEKCVNIVSIHAEKIIERDDFATVWGVEWYSKYALYDGRDAYLVSGHTVPVRYELIREVSGEWALQDIIYAQDGTLYASSIIDFCDGDQILANCLMQLPGNGTGQDFIKYLSAHGYDDVTIH